MGVRAEDRTTSAYNLGNAGLASKILRTMDLIRSAVVESSPDLGIEAVFFTNRRWWLIGRLGGSGALGGAFVHSPKMVL